MASKIRVLFLGEESLAGAGRYLAAVLTWSHIPFDYRPDRARLPKVWRRRRYDAVILSDYRYAGWTDCAKEWLIQAVRSGTGLMMIGGWASFTGLVGGYAGTELEELLPVRCVRGDDRVNQAAALVGSHATPVMVCGYHKAVPKPGSRTVLEFRDLRFEKDRPSLGLRHPALVLGQAGLGRTAAFMTDCAPHWAGGLVDWGKKRVRVPLGRTSFVEVGETYLRFFHRWISWVSRTR